MKRGLENGRVEGGMVDMVEFGLVSVGVDYMDCTLWI